MYWALIFFFFFWYFSLRHSIFIPCRVLLAKRNLFGYFLDFQVSSDYCVCPLKLINLALNRCYSSLFPLNANYLKGIDIGNAIPISQDLDLARFWAILRDQSRNIKISRDWRDRAAAASDTCIRRADDSSRGIRRGLRASRRKRPFLRVSTSTDRL